MNHVITTYGGGELFFLVFNGIAALFKQEGGFMVPLIHLSLMVGSVYVVILMLFQNHLIEGIRWLLWVIVATNLLFLPKTRIHIYDPLTNYHRNIDHVPLALGVFASITSQIGRHITEKLESVFTLPDYMPYHKTGTVFASSLMSQLGKFRITDPVFKGNMERFVNQCVVYDAMIGHKYTLSDLYNSPNIWELVTTNASPVLGFLYKEANTPGEIITCKEGAQRLNSLWDTEITRATARYGSRIQNRDLSQAVFNTELLGSTRLLAGAVAWADSAQNLLRQTLMIGVIEEGSQNKLSELGSAQNYAATKALLQQRSAYAAAGEIAAKTLPLFKNVIEALSYALFIFIVVLALMPNGHRVLLTYCGILVWTQLWAPLYAVLNLIMTLYGRAETMAQGAQSGLTFLNSAAIINANADMTTLAAWLSVSIPFISYGILKQGAAAFVGLAQHLGSAMQSAASGAASETVSGNFSLGNISLGTQAYQNTSAFQHMTSPSYRASDVKAMGTSGVEVTTFAGGVQALSDQGLSLTPVTLMANVNTAHETQSRLHEAQSFANSKSIAAGKSLEEATQKTSNLLNRLSSDTFSHQTFSESHTSTESKALQDHYSFVKDISETLGVSKATAHDLAVHIKAGSPEKWLASIGASTNLSSTMSNQELLQKAENIATQYGYTYSLDSAISAAKILLEGTNDSKGIELAQAAGASLSEAHHLREEVSLAQSKVKELSTSLSSSQRQDFQETRNVTQDFLQFVAHQPVNSGPQGEGDAQKIGMMGALTLLKTGEGEYEAYLERFLQEHPHYKVQRIENNQVQRGLEGDFEAQGAQVKASHSLSPDYQAKAANIEAQGKQEGLIPEMVAPFSEARVMKSLEDSGHALRERRADLFAHKDKQEDKVTAASQESVVLGNAQHAGGNLLEGGGRLLKTINLFNSQEAKAQQEQPKESPGPIRPQEPIPKESIPVEAAKEVRPQERTLRTLPDKKRFKKQISQGKKGDLNV